MSDTLHSIGKESVRFFRRYRLLSLGALATLSLGAAGFACALSVLTALRFPQRAGMGDAGYATIARDGQGGMSAPAPMRVLDQLTVPLAGYRLGYCAPPVDVQFDSDFWRGVTRVEAVSTNFFGTFARPAKAGVGFSPTDALASSRSVVIGSRRAREWFGSELNAVGRPIRLGGLEVAVAGVAADGFNGCLGSADVWIPPGLSIPVYLSFKREVATDIRARIPIFYGLVSFPAWDDALANNVRKILKAAKVSGPWLLVSPGITVDPIAQRKLGSWAGLALVVAIFLFLTSGLSFGGLLLARGIGRLGEVALKRRLGAPPQRLLIDLAAGPATVVIASALIGSAIAYAWLSTLAGDPATRALSFAPSTKSIAISLAAELALAAVAVLLMAVIPALSTLRGGNAPLNSYSVSAGKSRGRLLQSIVGAELVFCISAAIVAGLVGASALAMRNVSLGYDPRQRDVLKVSIGRGSFLVDSGGGSPLAGAMERALDRVTGTPQVRAAAVAMTAPFENSPRTMILKDDRGHELSVAYNGVSADYFRVMGTRLVSGTGFGGRLSDGDRQEAVVNTALARAHWPGADAIGQVIRLENPELSYTFRAVVVGVAEDQRSSGPASSPRPTVFLPLSGSLFATGFPMYLIVDGAAPLSTTAAVVDSELSSSFPGLGVASRYSVEERLRSTLDGMNARTGYALTGAAAIALIALIGLYSSLAHFVATKRRELAIRLACGASPRSLFGIVVGRAARIGAVAAAIALLCSPALRWAVAAVDDTIAWSWTVAGLATLACVTLALLAALAPAFRASGSMPSAALREEG
ncbi:MAG: ABC transporter permease [Acidobacteria bacterium]|nr:ABC transporter permease [Acidobacteriota bacterium]